MKADQLLGLIQQITDSDPHVRERGADRATDWISSYSSIETITLAAAISASAAHETDQAALEAQLHAILELTATGHVKVENLYLREIDRHELPAELQSYIVDLLEK